MIEVWINGKYLGKFAMLEEAEQAITKELANIEGSIDGVVTGVENEFHYPCFWSTQTGDYITVTLKGLDTNMEEVVIHSTVTI